jgi:hypothetical protein
MQPHHPFLALALTAYVAFAQEESKPDPARPQAGAAQDPRPATRPDGPRGRRQGRKPDTDLPEFTPVAAPTVQDLEQKQQFFWFTMYPDFLVKFDPRTDTVAHKVKLRGGMFWRTSLTHDRKRMLVVTNQQRSIEVVDLHKGEVVEDHYFQEEGMILRIRSVRECAGGVFWLVQTDRVKKHLDRYSFEPTEYLLYDSANKKTVRKLEKLPDGLSRARLSADGSHWIAQKDGDLVFLDARTLQEQGRIDLKTPRFFGAGAIRLGSTDLLDGRDPKRALMTFTTTDPVEKRRTSWGLIELDLENRKVLDVTEWGPSQSSWGMRVAPKRRIGVAMGRGRDDERSIATYDLTTGEKLAEAYHEFRPRRSLVAVAPDASKVYIGVAGSDFEVFDGKTLQRLPSVELEGEIVGRIYVVDGE